MHTKSLAKDMPIKCEASKDGNACTHAHYIEKKGQMK